MKDKKLRIEDALNATKAAVQEGVVAGGGTAPINAIPAVRALCDTLEGDERTGAKIVRKALEAPLRQIAKNAGLDALCDVLEGTTSIAVCEGDPVAAAKVVAEFSKKLAAQEKFIIKSGFVDGKVISPAEVQALAELPSREVLVATVLGTLIAPIRGLATVLDANISGLARVMQAIADQKGA